MSEVREKAAKAKEAARRMNRVTTEQKNEALRLMADRLVAESSAILEANAIDLVNGRQNGTSESLLDRLALNDKRIGAIAEGLRQIIDLPDPTGRLLDETQRPNGLLIRKYSVPLGTIGIVYEARPNVTVDAAGLCLKSGNAVVLRGGSAALESNKAIVRIMHEALAQSSLPADCIQLIESSDRASVDEMLKLNGLIDVIIPRGGRSLIQNVIQNSTVPVIETGEGICHTYLDEEADPVQAEAIVINAKVQRPSVCNSLETLLVHESYAEKFLPALANKLKELGVELRGCDRSRALVAGMEAATEEDWRTEYNDLILSVKVVGGLDEALDHIAKYGTLHSECIVTANAERAERFLLEVDAAAVYHNASTRFTDGFEFGYGAEIGISTQKLHARGPMGLPALTSTKFVVHGSGQIRR
ncbi:glutamate-5-semialdehyde dehydrogenase [Paenibacillus ginsengarvi]|uniref:Gamma-glutamyl phosphate reductase n=1 Tax=Paenibacillus ginsengarvi TaxID=400777 RepID=A0A3B0BIC2_9BACL|nr:glutamate-5-semialdehyde dehydrogenase [Paenibacillus ginsengarvi]RKN72421.1 glutamate-5-semialdehyde dehydrogenase [Paenibacillus ginsengarvi]